MSQEIFTSINPETTSGLMLVGLLDDFRDAVVSNNAGDTRPSALQAGGLWIGTAKQAAPDYYWSFYLYTGSTDIEIFRISILNNYGGTLTADGSFQVQHIAADTAGAILNLIKNRKLDVNNGQLLANDEVAEIKFVGATDTGTSPLVAYLQFTGTQDMTATSFGGKFSLFSTPDLTAAITEHIRLANSQVETIVPHKLNSEVLVSQNVATTATIAQLSATTRVVEMTGATTTSIQGINSASLTGLITIHNRSTAVVTLKNENISAASADRMTLLNSADAVLLPQESATLYYCTTAARWKLKSITNKKITKTIDKLNGAYQQYTIPSGVNRIRLTAFNPIGWRLNSGMFLDAYGNAYSIGGVNTVGQLGLGDVTPRSSPVAVLGGLRFGRNGLGSGGDQSAGATTRGALTDTGQVYMWGKNNFGQLGVGDLASRSSPVAVLGTQKFAALMPGNARIFALTTTSDLFAWGLNGNGVLGLGDVNPRSSPVAVLGGLKVSRMSLINSDDDDHPASIAITTSGDAYSWGRNTNGQLGLGDVTPRSSPVAVLGGIKWKKIRTALGSSTRSYSFGLATDGTMYAWGANETGQLGVGDVTPRSSPVAVLGGLKFYDFCISTYGDHVHAWTSDGTLYSWGQNINGQLGDGTVVTKSSPVAVLGGVKFNYVTSCNNSVWGISTVGTLYAWGDGTSIGYSGAAFADHSSPVAVINTLTAVWDYVGAEILDPSNIACNTRAILNDGTIYSWGPASGNGELGIGNVVAKTPPTVMLGSFGVAPNSVARSIQMNVNGGDVYNVVLSQGNSFFGNRELGNNIDHITIEYDN